jgi:hypothetical protein
VFTEQLPSNGQLRSSLGLLSRHHGNAAERCLPQLCVATSMPRTGPVRLGSARHGEDTALTVHVTLFIQYSCQLTDITVLVTIDGVWIGE